MKQIIFKTLSGDTNTLNAWKLHGLKVHDEDNDFIRFFNPIYKSKLIDGYTSFVFEDGRLFTLNTYNVKEDLIDAELKLLADDNLRQWRLCDEGIGLFDSMGCNDEVLGGGDDYDDDEVPDDHICFGEVYVCPWGWGKIETIIID